MNGDLHDASMLDLFRAEVESHTAVLNDSLLAVAAGEVTKECLEALMRASHSIKGAARIIGLQSGVEVAHAMEDCFVAAQRGDLTLQPEHVDVLLKGVDLLSRIGRYGSEPKTDAARQEIKDMAAALTGLREARPAPAKAPPPASPASEEKEEKPKGDRSARISAALSGSMPVLDLFRAEVDVHTAVLNDRLVAAAAGPMTKEDLDMLMRAAHSIKGAAGMVSLQSAIKVAHAMEDCFVAAQHGRKVLRPEDVDVLLEGVDLLTRLWRDGKEPATDEARKEVNVIATLLSSLHESKPPVNVMPAKAPAVARAAPPKHEISNRRQGTSASSTAPNGDRQNAGAPSRPPSRETVIKASATQSDEAGSRAVRVNAASLNRLMGLAGEARVESGWLEPFVESLRRVKTLQYQLAAVLDRLGEDSGGAAARMAMLAETRQRAADCEQLLQARLNELDSFATRADNLSDRLYREAIASRMRPFADGVQGFPRMVHDVARKLGKSVRFEVHGKTTEVDRDILEKLEAPLNHLLRNALDHGLESPQERLAAGKPERGHLRLEAGHRGGMLAITVADDGRGVDMERMKERIVERELAAPEMVTRMSDAELLEFLFLPGFSTANEVTEISGRGVGLNVVQTMVQEVGGLIHVSSELGNGTSFHLQLPITRSVLRALLVEIAGEPYAFPLARIDRILSVTERDVRVIENRPYVTVDGQSIGLAPAREILELDGAPAPGGEMAVVVVASRGERYGLLVDRFMGERDVVVRPLDPRLGPIANISAAALMEDGAPMLIVDVEGLVLSIGALLSGGKLKRAARREAQAAAKARKRILVVDDSLTVREVERKLLENRGYDVDVAADGMEGWITVRAGNYHLVISDVDMPRMNGIELVGRIKGDARLKDTPVMIVSYKDSDEDRMRGLEAGANFYLTKSSFHDESLLHAVRDLIGDSSGSGSFTDGKK